MEPLSQVAVGGLIKGLLDGAAKAVMPYLERHKVVLTTGNEEIEKSLEDHKTEIKNWSSEVSFSDYPAGRRTRDVFIPLGVYTNQLRTRFLDEELCELPLEEALSHADASAIIMGQPGAGKTTALKHLCLRFIDETKFLPQYELLVRIQLRDLNTATALLRSDYLSRALLDITHLRLSFPAELSSEEQSDSRRSIQSRVLVDWLNNMRALVILDGFDEITLKAKRDAVIEELRKLAPQLVSSAFFLTARTGEFNYHVPNVRRFELKPFTEKNIEVYATQWLGVAEAAHFLSQLKLSPFWDTAIRPLTVAHLCVIYQRLKRIPPKPKSVYRKIVRLLIEDWDAERSIERVSVYADFDNDRKAEFLANLAYEITRSLRTSAFSTDNLVNCYHRLHENFGLPKKEACRVVDELETHTGLIVKSGNDRFEFSHKSLQEYLAAEYMVKLPYIPHNMIELQTMPNELAVAVSISSQPSEYLSELVLHRFSQIRTSFAFNRSFITRLLLEQPDFENTSRVGVAFLCLYSQYLDSVIHNDDQLDLFIMDQLGSDFSALAVSIRSRMSLEDVQAGYHVASTSHTFDGDPVWRLEKKSSLRLQFGTAELPFELWVRESLLKTSATSDVDTF